MTTLPIHASDDGTPTGLVLTLREGVVAWVRVRILSGRFEPGLRLVAGDIAAELAVSITPVREALRDLAAEGVLTLSPRRGVAVRLLSLPEVQELRMLHALLSHKCGELIAQRITARDLEQARVMQARMAVAALRDYYAMNSGFHLFLHDSARSPELAAMLRRIHDAALPYLPAVFARTAFRFHAGLEEHSRLLDACAARDGHAAGEELMRHWDAMFAQIEAIVAEAAAD